MMRLAICGVVGLALLISFLYLLLCGRDKTEYERNAEDEEQMKYLREYYRKKGKNQK